MSWLAVLLVGLAVTDLTRSVRAVRIVPECVGAGVAILVGLLAGLTSTVDVVALVAIAAVVVAWGLMVSRAFGRGPAWPALVLLLLAPTVTVAISGQAGPVAGPLSDWLDSVTLPAIAALSPGRFLLLLGVLLVQLSTGNVIVRLVLDVTGTMNPAWQGTSSDPSTQLKGGRLLGPMERLFIVALALAGEVTAASIVVAAKGLLRFPELQSRPDQERIHRLTEYFLVGSFASWLVALSSLVLLARGV